MEYLCQERVDCSRLCFARFLQILNKLYKLLASSSVGLVTATSQAPAHAAPGLLSSNRPLQLQIERLARRLIVEASSMHDKNAIYDTFICLMEEEEAEEKQHNDDVDVVVDVDVKATSSISSKFLSSTSTSKATKTTSFSTLSTSTSASYLSEQLQFIM